MGSELSLMTFLTIRALAHQSLRSCRDCGRVDTRFVRVYRIRLRSLSGQYLFVRARYILSMAVRLRSCCFVGRRGRVGVGSFTQRSNPAALSLKKSGQPPEASPFQL